MMPTAANFGSDGNTTPPSFYILDNTTPNGHGTIVAMSALGVSGTEANDIQVYGYPRVKLMFVGGDLFDSGTPNAALSYVLQQKTAFQDSGGTEGEYNCHWLNKHPQHFHYRYARRPWRRVGFASKRHLGIQHCWWRHCLVRHRYRSRVEFLDRLPSHSTVRHTGTARRECDSCDYRPCLPSHCLRPEFCLFCFPYHRTILVHAGSSRICRRGRAGL